MSEDETELAPSESPTEHAYAWSVDNGADNTVPIWNAATNNAVAAGVCGVDRCIGRSVNRGAAVRDPQSQHNNSVGARSENLDPGCLGYGRADGDDACSGPHGD